MRKLTAGILLLMSVNAFAAEDFKGTPPTTEVTLGALTGLATINSDAGFTVMGTAAKKIVNKGFITQDINNQVFIEAFAGPTFGLNGSVATGHITAFQYSLHLRWDFPKDDKYTLYALGGVSGHVYSSTFRVFPRFGMGAFWNVSTQFALRGEISHELIVVGASFPF